MSTIINEGLKLVATTTVAECTKKAIETYIKPLLESGQNKIIADKKVFLIKDNIDEYIKRTYNNNLYMSTIVFKNQQKTINDLYIPLTVLKSTPNNDSDDYIRINKFRDEFIPRYNKVLLVDNAGMGKSTILKYLYLSSITENKGIPILVELRRLVKNSSIIEFITNEINGIKEDFSKEEILNLIEGGSFIFFFDGYDEIIDENKKEITENLQEFISKATSSRNLNNNFIISSRDENSLSCFSDFQRFDIKPLNREEAYELIRKYDNSGELSSELIEKLENEENLKIIEEFLINPLMVSLLYKAFEYKRTVPYKKQIFYRQVYDALFEDHDRTKGGAYVHQKKSKLDIEDFHKLLRALGIITLNKGVSYCKEEFIENIAQAKTTVTGLYFKENDFIYDIIHSVPLFIKDGVEYRWAHKSFQEYFAASYICFDSKEKQSKYLLKMMEDKNISKYYNVFDFCYDIDYKELRNTIIYSLIEEFTNYCNNSYNDDFYKDYDQKELNIRRGLDFINKEIYIRKFDSKSYKEITKIADHGERFDEAFKGWERNSIEYISRLSMSSSKVCIGFANEYRYHVLLRLLKNKNSPLVDNYNTYDDNMTDQEEFVKALLVGEYILDDNPLNILNNKDIFPLVNSYLIYYASDSLYGLQIPNYQECIKLKSIIDKELKSEKKKANELFL
ncbi:NACHT domain-containing protein [Tissierella sp.]|uniref:NACHT domain-containing protein n=1 Tax=Tissierella sp. TaxID=41274 RepID=UPI00285E966A|nr:NACHT domain-containing protein [Tissierella sp.]MDR7856317.1 NACHT domain-containing protein [Tissierella sp.]